MKRMMSATTPRVAPLDMLSKKLNITSSLNLNIPKWDDLIIPHWYNNVKGILKKIQKYSRAEGGMFRLKDLRKEKGISQLKLAMDLHMNQNSVSRYETEQREADYRTLILFADYFHVSIDYLLGRTERKEMLSDENGTQTCK